MLQPKRTKFRREQKGRMKGNAQRGNQLAFGSFGIKTLENCWLTAQQIEAARQAISSRMNREGSDAPGRQQASGCHEVYRPQGLC